MLWRMVNEYPKAPLQNAIETAYHYGLYDLHRLERMTLQNIAGAFFQLPGPGDADET